MPYNFSSLDFDDLKRQLILFIKESDVFQDYKFDGSALNSLTNLMTYIMLHQNYYLNMTVQDLFLDTASLYRNVVAIAKSLNYIPHRKISSNIVVNLHFNNFQLDNGEPIVIPENTKFISDGIDFCATQLYNIVENDTELTLYQRTPKSEKFQFDGNPIELAFGYEIDDNGLLTNNLSVYVYSQDPDINPLSGEVWSLYDGSMNVTGESKIYFLEINLNDKLELSFGDNTIGKKLTTGYWIKVYYGTTLGVDGNGYSAPTLNERIFSGDIAYSASGLTITSSEVSKGGLAEESIDNIKYNAPKFYEAQSRAVTLQDYQVIMNKIKELDNSIDFDIVNIWDGSEESPPTYGTIFATFKPTGITPENITYLDSSTKTAIITAAQQYMPLALRLQILNPLYVFINISSKIYYYKTYVTTPEAEVRTNITDFFNDELTYNSKLKYSKLVSTIDSPISVSNNLTEITLNVRFDKTVSASNFYTFDLKNTLKPNSIYLKDISENTILFDDGLGNLKNSSNETIGSVNYLTGLISFVLLDGIEATNNELFFDTLLDDVEFSKNIIPILNTVTLTFEGV